MRVRIHRVVDGDTVIVAKTGGFLSFLRSGKSFPVRLYGIDAPEMRQPFGWDSRKALEKMSGGTLELEILSTDRYGRRVGILHREGSRNLNLMMVDEGFAYAYMRYGTLDGVEELERRARSSGRGIWGYVNLERPWDYRRRMAARRLASRRTMRWVARSVFVLFATMLLFGLVRWVWPLVDEEMTEIVALGLDLAVEMLGRIFSG